VPVIINADYEKLKQILINLVDNAIKYTPDGGKVLVRFRKDRHEVIVSIFDTGRGIPKELIPRIFEKFQRLEGSLVKDVVGTGLGLFIVKELVKAHGGRIWVESQVEEGTTFHFALPL
jgi:signal transduction histidine kinase